tara:strand:+ start:67 stop:1656 length:1590 start_codon:yes stop_codon:yes gene_type:complete
MSFELSKNEILKEVLKSGKDPVYFIDNYAKIAHPLEGLIPFKLYDFQAQLLRDYNDHRFNVILKARQLGISTTTAAYIAWMMMFHRNKNILIIATKFQTAGNLVKKVKHIIKNLPPWMQIANIDIDNRASFVLSNGSEIKASSTSGDAGRSEALSLLVIDEAAHVEGLDELWTGLYSTLSTGGRCIALSTPCGVSNWFHRTYVSAENEETDFYPTKLLWDVHPDRDQTWFNKETKNMSRRQIAQELECSFLASGDTVIHSEDILFLEQMIREPEYKTGFDRGFWIWEKAVEGESYLLVSDVARGDGQDFSTCQILKLSTMEMVAEYQGKATPDVYATILNSIGREYGNGLLVVENNSVGFTVLTKLQELQYPNLYFSIKSTHEYIDQTRGEHMSNAVVGFSMTSKTRPLVIAKMEEFIRNKLIKTYSSRFFNEIKTFVWNNGRPEAMRGYNDDLIVSFAIACWVRDTAFEANKLEQQYRDVFVDSMFVTSTKLNTQIKGQEGYRKDMDLDSEMEKAKHTVHQFGWLYKG